jgi:hypothetical protein
MSNVSWRDGGGRRGRASPQDHGQVHHDVAEVDLRGGGQALRSSRRAEDTSPARTPLHATRQHATSNNGRGGASAHRTAESWSWWRTHLEGALSAVDDVGGEVAEELFYYLLDLTLFIVIIIFS